MLRHMDDETRDRLKQRDFIEEKVDQDKGTKSKLIISPDSKRNMQRNNFSQFVAILYIFVAPFIIVSHDEINEAQMKWLFVFDVLLMFDKFIDLFIGFFKVVQNETREEHRLMAVIMHNLSPSFFIEIVASFGPNILNIYYTDGRFMKNTWYGAFKIIRYGRLFETDQLVNEYLDQ